MRGLLLMGFIVFTGPLWADDFQDGMAAAQKGHYREAFTVWWPLARYGDPDAQHNLGVLYDFGLGVDRDARSAVIWYKRAAIQGHPEAQNNLGMMYFYGQGVNKDLGLARIWLNKAAANESSMAMRNLGKLK